MRTILLTILFFISLNLPVSFAQHTPLDRCVRDSLFRILPHESPVQQGKIYLETARLVFPTMPERSFTYSVAALKIAIAEKNDPLKAQARLQMGECYVEQRRYIQANEQFLASWNSYTKAGDTSGQITSLVKICLVNRNLQNNLKALAYIKKGLYLIYHTNDARNGARLINQLAITYQSLGLDEASIYFYNRALALFRKAEMHEDELKLLNSYGIFFLKRGLIQEGLAFYNWLSGITTASDWEVQGLNYTRIGHLYSVMKDHRSSLKFNFKALEMRSSNQATRQENSSLINIGGDYLNLDMADSGFIYIDKGMAQAQRYGQKTLVEAGYRHLYNYYLRHQNHKRALDCYARLSRVTEDINLEHYRNNIAILETNQQLNRILQSGKMIARQYDIQNLNLKYHIYMILTLTVVTRVGIVLLIGTLFLFLVIRNSRKKMQVLNEQLSREIRERQVVEGQTQDKEIQYQFITDNSDDLISHLDAEHKHTHASLASTKVFGYEPKEMLGKTPKDLMHPDFHPSYDKIVQEMMASHSSRQLIFQAQRKDGTFFWVESVLNPLFDSVSGLFKGVVIVTRDIQELKIKELEIMEGTKQKENLLKEIHHRVKNNFAILVSLINMQLAQTKNPDLLQSLTNLQLRIRTMSLVHEMLYRSSDFEKISFPGYLRSLASVVAGTYNRRDIELTIIADEVVMDIGASIPLGLIVNELLNNAYTHGFPFQRAGKISIVFKNEEDTGNFCLQISDDGIGFPDGVTIDQYKTMGLQVVQILCAQIEATLHVGNAPGASFTIIFPPSVK